MGLKYQLVEQAAVAIDAEAVANRSRPEDCPLAVRDLLELAAHLNGLAGALDAQRNASSAISASTSCLSRRRNDAMSSIDRPCATSFCRQRGPSWTIACRCSRRPFHKAKHTTGFQLSSPAVGSIRIREWPRKQVVSHFESARFWWTTFPSASITWKPISPGCVVLAAISSAPTTFAASRDRNDFANR